jgi:hypothetical protein
MHERCACKRLSLMKIPGSKTRISGRWRWSKGEDAVSVAAIRRSRGRTRSRRTAASLAGWRACVMVAREQKAIVMRAFVGNCNPCVAAPGGRHIGRAFYRKKVSNANDLRADVRMTTSLMKRVFVVGRVVDGDRQCFSFDSWICNKRRRRMKY